MKPNKDLDKAINNIKSFLDQQWIVMNQPEKPFDPSGPRPHTFEMNIHPFISIYKRKSDRRIIWPDPEAYYSQEAFLLDYEPYDVTDLIRAKNKKNFYFPKAPLNYGFQTKIESISKNDSGDLILKLNITNLLETQSFEHLLNKPSQKREPYHSYEMDEMYKQKDYFKELIDLRTKDNIDVNIFISGSKQDVIELLGEENILLQKLPETIGWEFESFIVAKYGYTIYGDENERIHTNDNDTMIMVCHLTWKQERGSSWGIPIILNKNVLPLFYLEQFISDFENKLLPKINTLNSIDWKYLEHVDPKIHASDIKDTAQLKALFSDGYFDPNKDNLYDIKSSKYRDNNDYGRIKIKITLVKLVENSANDQMGTLKALFDFSIPDFNINQFREITFYGFKRKA